MNESKLKLFYTTAKSVMSNYKGRKIETLKKLQEALLDVAVECSMSNPQIADDLDKWSDELYEYTYNK